MSTTTLHQPMRPAAVFLPQEGQSIVFPYLEVNQPGEFDRYLFQAFQRVQNCDYTWQAKAILYGGRRPEGLIIGGGRNYIAFFQGSVDQPPVAAIHFNPWAKFNEL